MLATALAPKIGYDAAAKLAKEAYETGRTIPEIAADQGLLPESELKTILDLRHMTEPGR
jgi:fumarate hydratase class II